MESFISFIVPVIRSKRRHAVNMQPVSSCLPLQGWISINYIFCCLIKTEFFKMVTGSPAPDYISFPIYLDNLVINKQLICNLPVSYIFMYKQKCISAFNQRFGIWCIVAYTRALTLIIMMLSCLPGLCAPIIADFLCMIKFPDDFSFPVYLNQIQ